MSRRRGDRATLDDVVELLTGIAGALMGMRATLQEIAALLREDDDEDA